MKKPGPMRRAGVDVDAGLRVGELGHHPRDERHAEAVQFVGDAVDGDRLQAGVAEDDLVVALRGRVAAEGRVHVLFERLAHVRQPAQQFDRLLLGQRLEVDVRGFLAQFVAQRAGDLLGQLVVQAVDQAADVVLDVADVQVLPPAVAGVEHLEEVGEDVGDRVAAGQRLVAEVVEPAALGVGVDELVGDLRQLFLEADVRGHDNSRIGIRPLTGCYGPAGRDVNEPTQVSSGRGRRGFTESG